MKEVLIKLWRWVRWPLLVLAVAYVVLLIYRFPIVMDKQKTAEIVAQIHAAKITLADVMGDTMIKTDVDQVTYDATVAGIDSNNNGIRDDVEIAIWKKYPNSAKIRAAELQYAMATQLMLTKVYNSDTWVAAAQEHSRAASCIATTVPNGNLTKYLDRKKEVENLMLNTQARKVAEEAAYKFTTSYGDLENKSCDVDFASLQN